MTKTNWENSTDWRDKTATKKQSKMLHGLVSDMITNLNRGQVHDLIGKMLGKANYSALKEDLVKKNRSWKWKEDLK